jgi:transcriptional regulator with XRE-family HTH domain
LGVQPETLSRIENGKQEAGESTDKLIRLRYALASSDEILLSKLKITLDEILSSWRKTAIRADIIARIKDNEWEPLAA